MKRLANVLRIYIIPALIVVMAFSSCEEDEPAVPVKETATMSDIDGNIYQTIKIGSQVWMAQNLKVKHYRDGTPVPVVMDPVNAWATSQDAFCIYNNSELAPGCLYNWDAVSNSLNLAPEGWHIPTDDEWKELEMHLGMSTEQADKSGWRGEDQGEQLRIAGISDWAIYENVWATNESGFSAEAGSCILFDGKAGVPGLQYHGFWWTISDHSSGESWYRYMDYKERGVFRSHGHKKYGFSVRCIKD